jgi:hypothetical protein
MRARIYQQPKTAMQSGIARTTQWVLEWEPADRARQDALMGWYGSSDTRNQVHLHFPTQEEAVAYAKREGIEYDLELPTVRVHKPKAYADNFKYGRAENWTH